MAKENKKYRQQVKDAKESEAAKPSVSKPIFVTWFENFIDEDSNEPTSIKRTKEVPEDYILQDGEKWFVPELTYFEKRMQEMGVTEEMNKVSICYYDANKGDNAWKDIPIFSQHAEGIEILVYHIEGYLINYAKDGSRYKNKEFRILRYETPKIGADGKEKKYELPKGQPAYPFFPPSLVEKFKAKSPIETLYLTEGYFKAFKGAMHGIDVVGLASITTLKEKESGKLHADILSLIDTCDVKKVVFLMDGDCLEPLKAGEQEEYRDTDTGRSMPMYANGKDLRKRPQIFFSMVKDFKTLLDDNKTVEKWFAYITSDNIEGRPKGLDDLLISFTEREKEIVNDLNKFSGNNTYFKKFNITYSTGKVWEDFRLDDVNRFVNFHMEKRPLLKSKLFVFNGTQYRWDDEKHECKVVVHGDANNYIRVGDSYYEKVRWVNKHGGTEEMLDRRQKGTIVDDYGKTFVKDINKYKIFCNLPDNISYQQTPHFNYNLYYPFEWRPEEGECAATMDFLVHIFGNKNITFKHPINGEQITVNELDLGLDYIQLLYKEPTQILPILCLVSKENETGKTTFGKWLQKMFKRNAVIVGNQDLSNDFNGHWLPRLIVICDETKIDKQIVIEKVKSLSTGGKAFMNSKGKDQVEIEIFCKFIFNSNNEDNFIYASEEDTRWWVRKIPRIPADKKVNQLEDKMADEIPAFLSMLQKREMATENLSRAWFHPDLTKTEALKKVIQASKSTIEKELRERIRNRFLKHNVTELLMDLEDIQIQFFKNKRPEDNYLRRILKDSLKLDTWVDENKKHNATRYKFPAMEEEMNEQKERTEKEVWYSKHGRPYVMHIRDFFTDDEIIDMDINVKDLPKTISVMQTELPLEDQSTNKYDPAGIDDSEPPF